MSVSAAGPGRDDVPLPLDARQPLLRGDASALELLPVAGARWALDGQAVAPAARLAATDGTARLGIGDLEVAVQGTIAPPRLPRFGSRDGAFFLRGAAHLAAAALAGLALTTESPDDCPCLVPPLPSRVAAPAPAQRRRPPVVVTPRWLAPAQSEAPRTSPRRTAIRSRSSDAVRRGGHAVAGAHVEPVVARWPVELEVDPVVDPIVALASAPLSFVGPTPGSIETDPGDPKSTTSRGSAAGTDGGLGSCTGALFATLARRFGRDTAIVACSPACASNAPEQATTSS